jgi:hypothetical protein
VPAGIPEGEKEKKQVTKLYLNLFKIFPRQDAARVSANRIISYPEMTFLVISIAQKLAD